MIRLILGSISISIQLLLLLPLFSSSVKNSYSGQPDVLLVIGLNSFLALLVLVHDFYCYYTCLAVVSSTGTRVNPYLTLLGLPSAWDNRFIIIFINWFIKEAMIGWTLTRIIILLINTGQRSSLSRLILCFFSFRVNAFPLFPFFRRSSNVDSRSASPVPCAKCQKKKKSV